MENAVFMTTGESVPYLANVDGKLDAVSKRVTSITSSYNDMLDTISDGVSGIGKQVADYMKQLSEKNVATQGGSNSFTGTNHFANIIVDSMSGKAVDDLKAYTANEVNAVKASIGNIKLPQSVSVGADSRDLTIYNGASTSSAVDSLYVWQETYPGAIKIYGVGKVHVDSVSNGDNFHIKLPYDLRAGDFIIGESYTDHKTKAEIVNGEVQVTLYDGVSNQDVWIDFEIAGLR